MEEPPDETLMQAIADRSDRAAFTLLFRRYAPRLRAFLRRGSLPESQVDELVQDVMLQAWRRADRYDPQRALVSTWLFTIARNRLVDGMRKQGRAIPEGFVEPEPAQCPEQTAALEQRARVLGAALAALPEEQRAAVVEVYFHHRTNAEAARAHDVPTGTQKSRLRTALAALRQQLLKERR